MLSKKRLSEIKRGVDTEIETAVEFGKTSPQPSIKTMETAVYAPHAEYEDPGTKDIERKLSYTEALNEAMHQEMATDDRVLLMGEDVGQQEAYFRYQKGYLKHLGKIVSEIHQYPKLLL